MTLAISGRGENIMPNGELVTFRGRIVVNISEQGEVLVFQAGTTVSLCELLT